MTVKGNQPTLHRQIRDQFTYGHHFPIETEHSERGHGRDTTWTLRAREATETIRTDWPSTSWIIEMETTGTRNGKPMRPHSQYFLTTLRTTPKALLRLIRQRWSIENEWHWERDVQLGEDAHHYTDRKGVPLLSMLRTIGMNMLRLNGFRSIHAGLQEVAHDIGLMLSLGGVALPEKTG